MKRPLPQIRWTSRTNGSPAHFQNWLAEYTLREAAAGDEDAASATFPAHSADHRDLAHLCSAFDSDPRVGEIRLLSAEFSSQAERPVYVAILKNWEGEGLVTAIFSPFSNPALGQGITGWSERGGRVCPVEPKAGENLGNDDIAPGWAIAREASGNRAQLAVRERGNRAGMLGELKNVRSRRAHVSIGDVRTERRSWVSRTRPSFKSSGLA